MAKKNWIMVKRGLSEDPKHREAMGECVWLFLHLIDRCDWETGIVYGWKDHDEAEDMSMPLRTMRWQRRKLQDLGYITCRQKRTSQDIVIHNWTSPKNYAGMVVNAKSDNKGDNALPPLDAEGDNKGSYKGSYKGINAIVTPTSNSKLMDHGSSLSGKGGEELQPIATEEDLSISATEKGRQMYDIISKAYQDKKRKAPTCFKNSFQRDAYLQVFDSLNGELEPLTRKAVSRDITALDRLLSWLEKCVSNNAAPKSTMNGMINGETKIQAAMRIAQERANGNA